MKPWLIPDKFVDNDADGAFGPGDRYCSPLDCPPDTDGWPPEAGEATGWSMIDAGTTLLLNPGSPHAAIEPSNYFQVGPSPIRDSIESCVIEKTLGEWIDTNPGGSVGQIDQGLDALLANGPVIVPIGMFSPEWYEAEGRPHGNFDIQIVNWMGFELSGHSGSELYGTIRSMVGDLKPGPTVGGGSLLLKQVVLVR
jgi:hypothetical protein